MKQTVLIFALALLVSAPLLSITREEARARFRGPGVAFLNERIGSLAASTRPQRLSGYIEQTNYDGWADTYAMGLIYDDLGRLAGWMTKMWNSDEQAWQWDWRGDVNYLPDGRYGRIDQYFYEDGWNPSGYTRFVYDGAIVDSLVSYYIWGEMEYETSRIDYQYSSQNGYLETITEFDSMIDRYMSRQSFGYDAQGRVSQVSVSNSWDDVEWQDNTRTTLTYHSTDTSNYSQFYDYLIDGTVFSFWFYGETHAPFKLETRSFANYEPDLMEWVTGLREQCFYDQDGRLDHRDYSCYDFYEGVWYIWNRYTYSYSDEGVLSGIVISSDEPDIGWWDFSRYNLIYENYSDGGNDLQPSPALSIRAWPNPFNPSTTVSFTLPSPGPASLAIYNLKGQLVKTLMSGTDLASGSHSVVWDGRDDSGRAVSSGLYFGRLVSSGQTSVLKMLLAK